ncbi:hypothetical protein Dsin_012747 [Dipteronia sinensis]|uniref:Uncharacterized protein n=1 Tax=Dipteronia sinensis TaxID=43782 RepID=A0AAE0AIN2_9ROSI|nr:hypothetical protein Dsin_012747 [Dipteronia sinensis]
MSRHVALLCLELRPGIHPHPECRGPSDEVRVLEDLELDFDRFHQMVVGGGESGFDGEKVVRGEAVEEDQRAVRKIGFGEKGDA